MPQIIRGAGSTITAIKHGNTDINEIRRGTQLIWSKAALRIDFRTMDDQVGLGSSWFDHGSAVSPYLASVDGGMCRINLPDNQTVIAAQRSNWRYTATTTTSADGYLEVGVGSRGHWDPAFRTIVYDHLSNTRFDDGIGIGFWGQALHIVRRVAGAEQDMKACGGYQTGDIIRMVHLNNGKLHQLYRNGRMVGWWDDSLTNSANVDVNHRSVGLSVYGRKDNFLVPRCYSAGISYIEAGGGDRRILPMATSVYDSWNNRHISMSFDNYVPVAGDFILVSACYRDVPNFAVTSPPAGWVELASVKSSVGVQYCIYHVVTQAEADATQTAWSLRNYWNSAHYTGVIATVFRGVKTSAPIDAFATGFNSANSSPHVLPGLPTVSNRSLVVGMPCAAYAALYPGTPPNGWQTLVNDRKSSSQPRMMLQRTALTQSGVPVPAANVTPGEPSRYTAITVALAEAPSS